MKRTLLLIALTFSIFVCSAQIKLNELSQTTEKIQRQGNIYEIREVVDLGSTKKSIVTMEVPDNSVIKLTTGTLTNGKLTGSFKVETDNIKDFLSNVDCSSANIINMQHLSEKDITDVFPDHSETAGKDFYFRHKSNIISSKFIYDISGINKVYYLSSWGGRYPIQYVFYDKDKRIIQHSDFSTNYETDIPKNAQFIGYIIEMKTTRQMTNWNDNLKKVILSFLESKSFSIETNPPTSIDLNLSDLSPIYVNKLGKCIYNYSPYKMICIPKTVFRNYKYLNVTTQTGNDAKATRIHFLKSYPQNNKYVEYSDYYAPKDYYSNKQQTNDKGQPISDDNGTPKYKVNDKYLDKQGNPKDHIGSIIANANMSYNYVIPPDCEYIAIQAITTTSKNDTVSNIPQKISLSNSDYINSTSNNNVSSRKAKQTQHKFMHWNVGHFTNGVLPSITVDYDNKYSTANYEKCASFKKFLAKYKNYNLMFNEYDPVFAKNNNGEYVNTLSLIKKRYTVYIGKRNNNYNLLAGFLQKNLSSIKPGVFESLKGVSNTTPSYEYGVEYVIYSFLIGESTVNVMHVHLANRIGDYTSDMLKEIVKITKDYDNIILFGDLNITNDADLRILTDALNKGGGGLTILNTVVESTVNPQTGITKNVYETTRPARDPGQKDYTLDWCLYRLDKHFTINDFKVVTEARELGLSDHYPIIFTLNYNDN